MFKQNLSTFIIQLGLALVKMTVSNPDGNLSSESGLILVKKIMDSLNFSGLSKQYLEIEDKRLVIPVRISLNGVVDLSKYRGLLN